jgi:hypothetical protein
VTAGFTITGERSDLSQAVTGDSPVSYWRLNELLGPTAADSAGSNPAHTPARRLEPRVVGESDQHRGLVLRRRKGDRRVERRVDAGEQHLVEAWIKPSALPAAGAFASVVTKAESYSLQFNGPKLEFTIMQPARAGDCSTCGRGRGRRRLSRRRDV